MSHRYIEEAVVGMVHVGIVGAVLVFRHRVLVAPGPDADYGVVENDPDRAVPHVKPVSNRGVLMTLVIKLYLLHGELHAVLDHGGRKERDDKNHRGGQSPYGFLLADDVEQYNGA